MTELSSSINAIPVKPTNDTHGRYYFRTENEYFIIPWDEAFTTLDELRISKRVETGKIKDKKECGHLSPSRQSRWFLITSRIKVMYDKIASSPVVIQDENRCSEIHTLVEQRRHIWRQLRRNRRQRLLLNDSQSLRISHETIEALNYKRIDLLQRVNLLKKQ